MAVVINGLIRTGLRAALVPPLEPTQSDSAKKAKNEPSFATMTDRWIDQPPTTRRKAVIVVKWVEREHPLNAAIIAECHGRWHLRLVAARLPWWVARESRPQGVDRILRSLFAVRWVPGFRNHPFAGDFYRSGEGSSMPSKAETYRVKAAECDRKASESRNQDVKATYADLARQWREMSRQAEDNGW